MMCHSADLPYLTELIFPFGPMMSDMHCISWFV